MTIRSAWHVNSTQSREDSRFAPLGMMTPNAGGALSTYNGVVPTSGNPMGLTSTGAMTAQIEVGRAVVQGLSTQGCYPVVITAPEPITFADGDALNPRIDAVCVVIRDDPYDSTGQTDVRVVVVPGAPAASPVIPSLPTEASIYLHTVRVPAGASAGGGGIAWTTDVTDKRGYTVAVGGVNVGLTPGAYAGQWRDTGGTAGTMARYNGSSWESAFRMDSAGQLIIGDTNLRRDGSNVLATDDTFRVYKPAGTDNALSFRTPADTGASRFFVNVNGSMYWGPGGTTATDTTLYRAGVDQLKTDSKFSAEVETVSTGWVNSAGWSSTFYGKKTCGVVHIVVQAVRTGTSITGDDQGNIGDQTIGTLPAGWRPTVEVVEGAACSGYGDGGANISTAGIVSLRTWSTNGPIVPNTQTIRMAFTFIP